MSLKSSRRNSFILTWRIENFSCCLNKNIGEFLESPKFSESSTAYEQWSLRLYPKGMNCAAYLSYQLCRSACINSTDVLHTGENTVDFAISILAKNGLKMAGKQIRRAKFTTQWSESSVYDFVKRDDLTSRKSFFLPEDTLTIQCNLMRPVNQHIVTSKCQAQTLSFTWTIKHFSKIPLSPFDHVDRSFILPIPCAKAPRFVLKFKLVGRSISESCVRVDCTLNSSFGGNRQSCSAGCKHFNSDSILVSFVLYLSDTNGRRRQLLECEHSFLSINSFEIFHLPELVKRSDLIARSDLFLVNDNLTLHFDLKISNGKCITVQETLVPTLLLPGDWRGNTLGKILLEDKKFCDVTLKVGNEEFYVHKSVICAKSSIFNSMFTCDMQEKKSGVVDIVDVSSDTMKHLLHYMYTDTLDVSVLDDIAVAHLYSAADKYQVISLVEACSALLVSKINARNVWDIASFAATYQDETLIKVSEAFLLQGPSQIPRIHNGRILLPGQ